MNGEGEKARRGDRSKRLIIIFSRGQKKNTPGVEDKKKIPFFL